MAKLKWTHSLSICHNASGDVDLAFSIKDVEGSYETRAKHSI